MKNYVQPGNTITLTAPYAVTSGDGLLVGSIFGIASADAALNDPIETALVGVFDITKVGSQAWTVGAKVYWDDTNKRTTSVATSNTLIGVATEAVAGGAGSAVCECLNQHKITCSVHQIGLPDRFVDHGSREELLAECGLDAAGIQAQVTKLINEPALSDALTKTISA